MNIEQLERAGRLLYGDAWQANMARSLNIDSRRIRQWNTGDRPMGDWVGAEVIALLEQNRDAINEYLSVKD